VRQSLSCCGVGLRYHLEQKESQHEQTNKQRKRACQSKPSKTPLASTTSAPFILILDCHEQVALLWWCRHVRFRIALRVVVPRIPNLGSDLTQPMAVNSDVPALSPHSLERVTTRAAPIMQLTRLPISFRIFTSCCEKSLMEMPFTRTGTTPRLWNSVRDGPRRNGHSTPLDHVQDRRTCIANEGAVRNVHVARCLAKEQTTRLQGQHAIHNPEEVE